jgi:hypothetical protein
MDEVQIKNSLVTLLEGVAEQARQDAANGKSNIGVIYSDDVHLNQIAVTNAIQDINKATSTKEGARRLISGLLVVAKAIARAV